MRPCVSTWTARSATVAHNVRQRGLDGAICGHIHAAVIKPMDGFVYMNCGDWVDSCTALVEHGDGRMELIEWISPVALGGAGAGPGATQGHPEEEAERERETV